MRKFKRLRLNGTVFAVSLFFAVILLFGSKGVGDLPLTVRCKVSTVLSGKQEIYCQKLADGGFVLRDMTKGDGLLTLHGDKGGMQDYYAKRADWRMEAPDANALDAHFGLIQTYLFYKHFFARNSLDGKGMRLVCYVNDAASANNALWDGRSLRLGVNRVTGKPVASLDVIGHELTHGLIDFSCRLKMGGESGAIAESICDIMGKCMERWSVGGAGWVMGEKCGLVLRDFEFPNRFDQPAIYQQDGFWYNGASTEQRDHRNSGVGNLMFFLLVNGNKGRKDLLLKGDFKGIGMEKAAAIIYRSMTVYLHSRSDYEDWRKACVLSAEDLYGKDSKEKRATELAWSMVMQNK